LAAASVGNMNRQHRDRVPPQTPFDPRTSFAGELAISFFDPPPESKGVSIWIHGLGFDRHRGAGLNHPNPKPVDCSEKGFDVRVLVHGTFLRGRVTVR
jgi:hypothetical protein